MDEMTADHVIRNRAAWDAMAADYVERGRSSWAAQPNWGVWSIPETEVHLLHMLTVPANEGPADETLKRDYFGMHRVEWPDEEGIEFHLGYGDWIRVLRRCGFSVENLVELRPPEGTSEDRPYMTAEWARRWPTEEVWVARRI